MEIGLAKISEAAAFLNLSKAMVNKMVRDGRIPFKRFGKVYRIPWSWLRGEVNSASPDCPVWAKLPPKAS